MNERQTPEEIAEFVDQATGLYIAEQFLDRLDTEGYVITHPDDVPEQSSPLACDEYTDGWNACRAHIFGEGA